MLEKKRRGDGSRRFKQWGADCKWFSSMPACCSAHRRCHQVFKCGYTVRYSSSPAAATASRERPGAACKCTRLRRPARPFTGTTVAVAAAISALGNGTKAGIVGKLAGPWACVVMHLVCTAPRNKGGQNPMVGSHASLVAACQTNVLSSEKAEGGTTHPKQPRLPPLPIYQPLPPTPLTIATCM